MINSRHEKNRERFLIAKYPHGMSGNDCIIEGNREDLWKMKKENVGVLFDFSLIVLIIWSFSVQLYVYEGQFYYLILALLISLTLLSYGYKNIKKNKRTAHEIRESLKED